MSTYCRLCAEERDRSDIVTTINDSSRLIEQKLIACCQWDPQTTEDKLPQDVCLFCLDKLENCWMFRQSVKQAQHKIRDIFEFVPNTEKKTSKKSKKPKYECSDCLVIFVSRIALERHECTSVSHIFQCNLCNKTFKTNEYLRSHCKKQESYKCSGCQQIFCSERRLIDHQNYSCNVNDGDVAVNDVYGAEEEEVEDKMDIDQMNGIESKPAFVDCNPIDLEQEIDKNLIMLKEEPEAEQELELDPDLDLEPELDSRMDPEIDSAPEMESDPEVQPEPKPQQKRKRMEQRQEEPSTSYNSTQKTTKLKKHAKPPRSSNPFGSSYETKVGNLSIRTYKYDPSRSYECHLCGKEFSLWPSMRNHLVVHTLPRKYKCQYCANTFRKERYYTSHLRKHIDFKCEYCQKKFVSAFALKVHKRMHTGASVRMHGCAECDHYFIDVSTFYNHMRRRHGLDSVMAKERAVIIEPNGTAKPFVCEICAKDFFDRSSLEAHKTVHMNIRPFKCNICPKTFKNKYNLKAHEETHTREKSVQCTECGKQFSCKSALKNHMEGHTGVFTKIFNCDFCDRVFRNSYNMQQHRRTHTGEKPFRCDICNMSMTTASQLKRHFRTVSHVAKLNESTDIQQSTDIV